MTPAEHYQEAQEWLRRAKQSWESGSEIQADTSALAAATIAQVHMTAAIGPQHQTYPHSPLFED